MSKKKFSYTVAVPVGPRTVKLAKIVIGTDCSYYVSIPYHVFSGAATLAKFTVNYETHIQLIEFSNSIDFAKATNDKKTLKLSHHPDGFVQFSGPGVTSGPGKNGFAVQSWPLDKPVSGPSFTLFIRDFEQFKSNRISDVPCIFDLPIDRQIIRPNCVLIEGFYFPRERRISIYDFLGTKRIKEIHPNGTLLTLKVLDAPDTCQNRGFLAMHCSFWFDDLEPKQFLSLNSSTGNIRFNEQGQKLGDGLHCLYPASANPEVSARSLDYKPTELPEDA